MKFQNYINEKRKNNVIVVDVQPMYKDAINFSMSDFINFLLQNNKILFFYNGPDTVGTDTKKDIINGLSEELMEFNSDETEERKLYYKLTKETIGIDKGYGFFRGGMDSLSNPEKTIKKAIRFMASKKVNDSRDIEPNEGIEEIPELEDIYFDDNIYLPPDIRIDHLKKWSGSYLVGGGKDECLKEVKILMDAFNIGYTTVQKFIY